MYRAVVVAVLVAGVACGDGRSLRHPGSANTAVVLPLSPVRPHNRTADPVVVHDRPDETNTFWSDYPGTNIYSYDKPMWCVAVLLSAWVFRGAVTCTCGCGWYSGCSPRCCRCRAIPFGIGFASAFDESGCCSSLTCGAARRWCCPATGGGTCVDFCMFYFQ